MQRLASKVDKDISSSEEVRTAVKFYNQAITAYKMLGPKAHRQISKWNNILRKIEDKESFLNSISLFHETIMKELSSGLPPTPTEEEGPEPYNNLTLSQRRGKYLAEYAEQHNLRSVKTSEARAVLQTVEKVRLKPTQIIRALHEASKWINSKMDHSGAKRENRLKIIGHSIIKKDRFFMIPDLPDVLRSDPI